MDPASTDDAPRPQPALPSPQSARRLPIGEDWLATIVGLALVALVLLGVVTKAMIP